MFAGMCMRYISAMVFGIALLAASIFTAATARDSSAGSGSGSAAPSVTGVVSPDTFRSVYKVVATPDGSRLVMLAATPGSQGVGDLTIWSLHGDGSHLRRLSPAGQSPNDLVGITTDGTMTAWQ